MDKLLTLNALWFTLLALFGIVLHVVNKWSSNDIGESVYEWFLGNPRSTVAMAMAVLGGLVLLIANGQANNINDIMQVIAVVSMGYIANSAINKQ